LGQVSSGSDTTAHLFSEYMTQAAMGKFDDVSDNATEGVKHANTTGTAACRASQRIGDIGHGPP
jgi:hypothetical protein